MPEDETDPQRRRLGRIVSIVIVAAAFLTGALVIIRTNNHPRTDDAEVFANFIASLPRSMAHHSTSQCRTTNFRKEGELLFEIDPRPYQYAAEKARSDLADC